MNENEFGMPKIQITAEVTGVVRQIDGFGRMSIPVQLREIYHLTDCAELICTNQGILMRPATQKE
ncbi:MULTISPECIES: hypothetical protein [Caproicibacterium]|uniref:Uncharacterized protein n=1 Tax=Caproicibacterium argilliputei TaxID=3030016 RepID=A0AA97DAB7_9FIRM|nr:hypothetical protein [Caproicibacterium argilliputei]WOC32347.1 hypothetical protein PXC00_00335 [Caproicibacterium argilliputei]